MTTMSPLEWARLIPVFIIRSMISVTNTQTNKTLQTFPSPAGVRQQIVTKLFLLTENVRTIFASPNFFRSDQQFRHWRLWKFRGNLSHHDFLLTNPLFISRIPPNLKHLYKKEACINDINFTKIEQGSRPCEATKFENLPFRFFSWKIPKFGPINVKFGTTKGTAL